ncbi:hypothetical protein QNE31_002742 [Vibrio parahaemolyticus]|nr:hypothetical protein [Vibrio parahaemolyticus]MBE3856613.1 hypothetical protein [Vibrio parahaemolyticus]
MDFKYSYFIGGSSDTFAELSKSLCSSFDPLFKENEVGSDSSPFRTMPQMQIDTSPKNDVGLSSELVVGVCTFLTTWAGTKFLDEYYDTFIKPGFKKLIHKLHKVKQLTPSDIVDFYSVVTFTEQNCVIVIRCTMALDLDDEKKNVLIMSAFKNAGDYIENCGVKAPIHYYHINNGNMNLEPMLRESLMQIHLER